MRKPIAIAILPETEDRFGDDGTIWAMQTRSATTNKDWQSGWQRVPDLPQDKK